MLDKDDLHSYQVHSIQHIIDNNYAGLLLDMGAGKTVITLSAIDYLMYSDLDITKALVVAPKRVAENVWTDEIEIWKHLQHLKISVIAGTQTERIAAIKVPADIYTIGRDNFTWLCNYLSNLKKFPFEMVVFDESSSFKNSKSLRWKTAKKIRPQIRRALILTGTPAPQSLMDLWSQIYLLDLGKRLGRFITSFRNTYFNQNPYVPFKFDLKVGADKLIYDKISDICISITNADTGIQLPELVVNRVSLTFDENLKKKYKDFEKEKVLELLPDDKLKQILEIVEKQSLDKRESTTLELLGSVITAVNAAVLFTKLAQFTNGAIYDNDGKVVDIHSLKLDALEELVEEAQGSPMIVAYTYRHDKDRILERLKKYSPKLLTSGQDIKDWNEGKIRILVAHPASMGHGLNMQHGGNYITWYGLTPSLELYQQLNARLHRQGRKERVIVNILSVRGTVDDRLFEIIVNKDKTQASLMDALRVKIMEVLSYGK